MQYLWYLMNSAFWFRFSLVRQGDQIDVLTLSRLVSESAGIGLLIFLHCVLYVLKSSWLRLVGAYITSDRFKVPMRSSPYLYEGLMDTWIRGYSSVQKHHIRVGDRYGCCVTFFNSIYSLSLCFNFGECLRSIFLPSFEVLWHVRLLQLKS